MHTVHLRCLVAAVAALLLLVRSPDALAQVGPDPVIPYSGVLESDGTAVNSVVDFNFALFDCDDPDDGCEEPLWVAGGTWGTVGPSWINRWPAASEAFPVSVFNGRFAVELGRPPMSSLPFELHLNTDELYLAIQVEGVALRDLQRIGPAFGAHRAFEADDLRVRGNLTVESNANIAGSLSVGGDLEVETGVLSGDGSGLVGVGRIRQLDYDYTNEFVSCDTIMPFDTSRPEVTEGCEIARVVLTPTSADSVIFVMAQVHIMERSNTSDHAILAVFDDQEPGSQALAAAHLAQSGTNFSDWGGLMQTLNLQHTFVAGTTDALTLTVRAGVNGGTAEINGTTQTNCGGGSACPGFPVGTRLGGALLSGFTVLEFVP